MAEKRRPYITIEAEAPLDPRWTRDTWWRWSRLLATCRLKRACTRETWPAAVLRLRTVEAMSILETSAKALAGVLADLSQVASLTYRKDGDRWVVSIDNYAIYQKLGRPTYAGSSDLSSSKLMTPPSGLTSPRSKSKDQDQEGEREREAAAPPPAAEPAGLVVVGSAPPPKPKRQRTRLPLSPPPAALCPEDRQKLIAWCKRVYPDLGPDLATISASTLDYWRGDGRMKADWCAVVRDRVRWTAERRGLRPRPPPLAADPVDLSDPALGGQPLFADEVASG